MLRHKKGAHTQEEEEEEADLSTTDLSESETENSTEEQEETDTDKGLMSDSYDPWDSVVQKAFDKCAEQFEEEVTKLVHTDGISTSEARSHVYNDMRSKYRKAMITVFTNRMVWFDALRKHSVYKAIKKTATNLIDLDDYSPDEAWKSAIGQRKYLFDTILDEYSPPEMESEDDESESEAEQEDASHNEAEESPEKKRKR
jgi:hypothetical protein